MDKKLVIYDFRSLILAVGLLKSNGNGVTWLTLESLLGSEGFSVIVKIKQNSYLSDLIYLIKQIKEE